MPVYEYFCRSCNTRYDKLRPLREADTPSTCPTCNEQNSVRTLSVFITMSSGGESRSASSESSMASHGGCACGGACGCASHTSKN
jgi:putative FmdB family regulatory protein